MGYHHKAQEMAVRLGEQIPPTVPFGHSGIAGKGPPYLTASHTKIGYWPTSIGNGCRIHRLNRVAQPVCNISHPFGHLSSGIPSVLCRTPRVESTDLFS